MAKGLRMSIRRRRTREIIQEETRFRNPSRTSRIGAIRSPDRLRKPQASYSAEALCHPSNRTFNSRHMECRYMGCNLALVVGKLQEAPLNDVCMNCNLKPVIGKLRLIYNNSLPLASNLNLEWLIIPRCNIVRRTMSTHLSSKIYSHTRPR
mgnify:CR=1 FL=1